MTLRFEKWEGLGNDFILVEEQVTPEQAKRLCDRRRSIGADGVLCVTRHTDSDVAMVVLNADGSRPEMCGNGLRCVAAWVALRHDDLWTVAVHTDAGLRRCDVNPTDHVASPTFDVSAGMGVASIGGTINHSDRTFHHVDVGNPHAVSFDPHSDRDLDLIGPALEQATTGGINVELCTLHPDRIDVIVWERGVGRTLACGTGACAVAAAACHAGHRQNDTPLTVALPGGELVITVSRDMSLRMTGPARRVFVGEL